MNDYMVAAISGGKDSTAMLLLMLERDMPIDAVVYADTGMDFPEMGAHIEKLDELLCRERGIHINTVRHPRGFEWIMFEQPKVKPYCIEKRRERGIPVYGNGWPGPHVRWCTGHLKTKLPLKCTEIRLWGGSRIIGRLRNWTRGLRQRKGRLNGWAGR